MLLRVFGCFMYMLLYPGQSRKSLRRVINVDEDPLAVQFCLREYLGKRDFNCILESSAVSVPR